MASTTAVPAYGVVTIEGTQYIERPQIYTTELTVTTAFQLFTNQRLTLPGVANFLLKGLTRDITIIQRPGVPFFHPGPGQRVTAITPFDALGSVDRRFRFRITNAEGSTWFFTGGLGMFNDRVVDTCCFGNGQFPYPLIPPVPLSANATLIYEVEDMGFGSATTSDPDYYPYTIHFAFAGSLLIPAAQIGSTQSIVYAVAPGTNLSTS